MSKSVWGQHLVPIDGNAARVAGNDKPEAVDVVVLEALRDGLHSQRDLLKLELVPIKCSIHEAAMRFQKYGLESPHGWFFEQKLAAKKLEIKISELQRQISGINERLQVTRIRTIADRFMNLAALEMDPDQFRAILTKAEAADVIQTMNFEVKEVAD
jgi:hypothetical protein